MLLAQSDELGFRFDCPINCAEPTLLGYDNNVHDLFELGLIVFAVEPFVHAHAVKIVESFLCALDDGHGDGVIGSALHHLMVQDEAVLVLDHAHSQAKLHRNAGLALADPLCMRLEQGEDLLLVRNVLTLQHPTVNLVDLPLGVPHELVELPQEEKPMLDEDAYRVVGPDGLRDLIGDGSFGGLYQRADEEMLRIWQTGVEEVRELLESGWRRE